jgi:hypothetical protein
MARLPIIIDELRLVTTRAPFHAEIRARQVYHVRFSHLQDRCQLTIDIHIPMICRERNVSMTRSD